MTVENRFLIDNLIEKLSLKLSQNMGLSIVEAMKLVYNSKLYDDILDIETGLYFQSPDYNYIHLLEELKEDQRKS